MAHNLATIGGTTAMAYLDATPWHNLGHKLNLAAISREAMVDYALDVAKLRYKVASLPIYMADGTEIKGHKASVRLADNGIDMAAFFSIVGEGYQHIQNERAVDVVRVLVAQFGFVVAALGALGDGERCWMLLRAADAQISPISGDAVNGYALLTWGHDGNLCLSFLGTTIRVVCQNTLNMATRGRRDWIRIRHTTSADARIDEAAKMVEALAGAMQLTGETFASLARFNMNETQVRAFIDTLIPTDTTKPSPKIVTRRDTIVQLVTAGRGADLANSLVPDASAWGVVNAVSEYFDHVRPAEAASVAGRQKAVESAIFGGNADVKNTALLAARELVLA